MANLNIGSFNVKGLADEKKRKEVFNWLREKKMNVYMLQETHFTKENENIIEAEWGFKCIFSNCSSQSCGVALLFNNNFQFVIKNTVCDENGRYIICELELSNERIIVTNFYGLNTDNTLLLESFIDDIDNFNDKPLICGGDWNLVLDEKDKKGGSTKLSHTKNREKLKSFIDRNNLTDVWRTLNPKLERYTWRQKTPNIQCRLDFFLISIGLLNVVNNVDIIYGYKSDHSFISVEIEKNSFARGKGFFKLNTSLLLDKDYVELIRKLIQKQKNIYDEQNVNPNLKWEMIKSDIRGETIKYSSKIAKINKVKTINIERELTELQNKKQASNREEIEKRINLLENELKTFYEKKTEGAMIRAKAKWLKDAEKNTKYFFNLEKRNYINKTIQQLINDKGDTITDFKEVLAEERSFYKSLYSKNHTVYDNINEVNNFFLPDDPEIPKLSEEDMLNCEGIISKDECVSAIRTFKNGKSPGTDGLPAEFYKIFWNDVIDLVIDSYQYTYDLNEMSISQRQSIITLLPKPEKDTKYLNNWRPISLLNIDYKLMTNV